MEFSLVINLTMGGNWAVVIWPPVFTTRYFRALMSIMTAADDTYKYFSLFFRENKT